MIIAAATIALIILHVRQGWLLGIILSLGLLVAVLAAALLTWVAATNGDDPTPGIALQWGAIIAWAVMLAVRTAWARRH